MTDNKGDNKNNRGATHDVENLVVEKYIGTHECNFQLSFINFHLRNDKHKL